mmetsp:Transcript_6533/g.11351  ORF Transcript_6533/g.11351 Transcript_6533/m.11351 type:complete len:107 (+) Transcript_6533:92-412(+)
MTTFAAAPTADVAMAAAAPGAVDQHIQLKVKDQHGSEIIFRIKRSTPLKKLIDAYCMRNGLASTQVRIMVDGERIAPEDTADYLGLENDDVLDAVQAQHGGWAPLL